MLEQGKIQKIIAHRYPFLFVDRIMELEPGKKGVGLKNVSINEPFFQGHFPNQPIMPGVISLECMAQMAAIIVGSERENESGEFGYYFTSVNNARFIKPVMPGDQLIIEVEIMQRVKILTKALGQAFVNGDLVAKAELGFAVISQPSTGE